MTGSRLILTGLLGLISVAASAYQPLVTTDLGQLRGERDRENTLVWRGVPYAQPPVDDLRWRAPRPPEPWEGVRDARRFESPPMQYSPVFRNRVIGSEDCLYLNIWRPDTNDADLPVYVWIHGGGNSIGSANQVSDFYGHAVASRSNMVFVSINYRLGPLGWFLHPSFQTEPDPADRSGNYGTLDIIAALEWIQEQIKAFGGNPERVLVSGESAGAMNILSLLISPRAAGLFSHALIQSGIARSDPVEAGESIGLRVEDALFDDAGSHAGKPGGSAEGTDSSFRKAMLTVPGRDIMRVFDPGGFGMLGLPQIFADGYVLPEEGFSVLDTGGYPNKVPIIIGSNQEELKLFLAGDRELRREPEFYQAVTRHLSDEWKIDGVDSIARLLTQSPDQPPVYAYHFRWGAPDEEGESVLPGRKGLWYGSFHSLEVPFFLGTDTIHGPLSFRFFRPGNRAGREALSEAMMHYVSRFVRTGSPSPPAVQATTIGVDAACELMPPLPAWQPWSNEDGGPKSLILDYRDDTLAIRMMNQEYTAEYLRGFILTSYEPEFAAAVLERLEIGTR